MKGFTTIHAGSARQALTRLRFICQLSDTSNELPMSALNSLVSEAVDVVVHCRRTPDGPRVGAVACVEDLLGPADGTNFTLSEVFGDTSKGAGVGWTGVIPTRLARTFEAEGLDVREHLDPGRRSSS